MKKYLSAVFKLKFLVLPIILISSVSQAIVVSNVDDLGVDVDLITKKSRKDWSCWETNPSPDSNPFAGTFCGIIKVLPNPETGEDGYIGAVGAGTKGLSALGRYVVALNNRQQFYWFVAVEVAYSSSAYGSYQLELLDEDWNYIDIKDQVEELCTSDFCSLYGDIPIEDLSIKYRTEKNIYVRMVVFGSKKNSQVWITGLRVVIAPNQARQLRPECKNRKSC